MTTPRVLRTLAALGLAALVSSSASAATITIVNNNAAGVGFNDPTPVAPVGGNPGTTLGAQRLFVFQYAANIWGAMLTSPVTIQVNSTFSALTCTATSATLGSTGSNSSHRDFAGAPFPGTWYVQSLANKLNGNDLNATTADMTAQFNLTLDNGSASCLGGSKWYYGIDGNEGTVNVELLPVVIHELAHGLGFATITNGNTGNYSSGFPSVYDHFLVDVATGNHWSDAVETAANRKASAISATGLVWDGPGGVYGAAHYLAKRPRMKINAPISLAGNYTIGTAAFGPALTPAGVTGDVVLVTDATAPTSDGCEAWVNGPSVAGKFVLIDRGVCTFVAKAESAQAYGAIGVLIANNTTGIQPPGGADPAITIPVVGISQADGNSIKSALLSGPVNVTLGLDPTFLAGADNSGRPLMYAPTTFASGSSVSHWDVTMTPNALMEPAINNDLHDNVDITRNLLSDIGWLDLATATTLARFTAEDRSGGILVQWQFTAESDPGAVTLERAPFESGPWEPVAITASTEDGVTHAVDLNVELNRTYYYRLSVMDRQGVTKTYGLAAASHTNTVASGPAVLLAPSPNPARNGAAVAFRISRPEFVHLAIYDASGRAVRTLRNGMMTPGEHTELWDGRGDAGSEMSPGLYFVTLRTSEGRQTQRLAVVR